MSAFGFLLVLLAATLTMAANLFIRRGIESAGGFHPASLVAVVESLVKLFLEPVFALGFVLYFLASVVWFRVVATEPLSTAYPVLVSLTFTLVTAGAVVMFSEPLTARKIAGLAAILAGILLISLENSGTA